MADEANIVARDRWFAHEDKDLRFTIYQDDEDTLPRVAQNITGWDITVYLFANSTVLATKTTGGGVTLTDPTNGVGVASFDAADIDEGGVYEVEIWRVDTGNQRLLSFGKAVIGNPRGPVAVV